MDNPLNAPSPVHAGLPRLDLVLVMGVSGCGKTTIARRLSKLLGGAMLDADDFHTPQNVARMKAGTPLTDDIRKPWLIDVNAAALAARDGGTGPVVLACSALRRAYRDILLQGFENPVIVHLAGSKAQLKARLEAREDHFMPASLLTSQLETLEPVEDDEPGFTLDFAMPPAALAEEAVSRMAEFGRVLAKR